MHACATTMESNSCITEPIDVPIFEQSTMPSMPRSCRLASAALCAVLGYSMPAAQAQQNAPILSVDVVNDGRLPADTYWRVTAGARLSTDSWCMFKWLKCMAFGGAEGRVAGTELMVDPVAFRSDETGKRRNLVTDLVSGLRFDFADSRGAVHGPWYLQFKVARRGPEIRSSVPIPRRTMATVSVGVDF